VAHDPAFPASKAARVLFAGHRRTRPPMLNQRGLVPAEARRPRTRLSDQPNRKYGCLPQPTGNSGNNGCVVCHPCRDARGRFFSQYGHLVLKHVWLIPAWELSPQDIWSTDE
jgi:hypothetical protein